MLEIIIIWKLAVRIGNDASEKGLKKLGYQIMAVLLWLCGEVVGAILGSVIFGAESSFWLRYVSALMGALTGAAIAFVVMRFVPKQEPISGQTSTEILQETPSIKKIARSAWVPILVIALASFCLCSTAGLGTILRMRSLVQQMHADNPIIGVKLDDYEEIVEPVNEISSETKTVYFGFDFEIPDGGEMPITFDWYMNGELAYSFERTFGQGSVVVALDREQLEVSNFSTGNYQVFAHIGELVLTSAEFAVK